MTGLPQGCCVRFSLHSQQRYVERVRPTVECASAARELERVCRVGAIRNAEPEWLRGRTKRESELYLLIGDDIVFPLVRDMGSHELVATTCIARGGISDATRAYKRKRRQAAAHRRNR